MSHSPNRTDPKIIQVLQLLFQNHRCNSGFTLAELLIAALMGSIISASILWLVVQLINNDRREVALSETDREVQLALDYIRSDLQEAVSVYDGSCNSFDSTSCPAYENYLTSNFTYSTFIPVLAFWKSESVDVSNLTYSNPSTYKCTNFTYPANPSYASIASKECSDLLNQRTAYALVVYAQDYSSNSTWAGESRITRYELPKYSGAPVLNSNLSLTLKRYQGFVDPAQTGVFNNWPFNATGTNCQTNPTTCGLTRGYDLSLLPTITIGTPTNASNVLIDFVAHPWRKYNSTNSTSSLVQPTSTDPSTTNLCPTSASASYSYTPRDTTNNTLLSRNFYVCVRQANTGQFQDIIVYLRGNPLGRSGVQQTVTMPLYQTQVTMRGVINRTPSN